MPIPIPGDHDRERRLTARSIAFVSFVAISLPKYFPRHADHDGSAANAESTKSNSGFWRNAGAELGQVVQNRVERRFGSRRY